MCPDMEEEGSKTEDKHGLKHGPDYQPSFEGESGQEEDATAEVEVYYIVSVPHN